MGAPARPIGTVKHGPRGAGFRVITPVPTRREGGLTPFTGVPLVARRAGVTHGPRRVVPRLLNRQTGLQRPVRAQDLMLRALDSTGASPVGVDTKTAPAGAVTGRMGASTGARAPPVPSRGPIQRETKRGRREAVGATSRHTSVLGPVVKSPPMPADKTTRGVTPDTRDVPAHAPQP